LKNKSAGDGCRDKTIEKTILRAFRARTFSRSQGQTEKNSMRAMFSGLLRIADIDVWHLRDGKTPRRSMGVKLSRVFP
jgi:hypothetical protein